MRLPLCKEKFGSKEIVSAKRFAKHAGHERCFEHLNPVGAIMVLHPGHIKDLVQPLHPKDAKAGMYAAVYLITHKKKKILVVTGYGFGSPAIAHVVEELAARGVKNFINFGGCGGISADLCSGDILIIDRALRDEGTSYHYIPAQRYVEASKKLTARLVVESKIVKTDFKIGSVWTTDAMFRETAGEVRRYRNEGILAVEMEVAGLFSVAKKRKLQAASILVVNDVVDIGEWRLNTPDPVRRARNVQKAFNIALDAIVTV